MSQVYKLVCESSHDEILLNTQNVLRGLESLKDEHSSLLGKFATNKYEGGEETQGEDMSYHEDKYEIVQSSLDRIELGIGEAQILMALCKHVSSIEAEKDQLETEVKNLSEENQWLSGELAMTQEKLRQSEQSLVQIEEEKKHLEYMNSLKVYDDERSFDDSGSLQGSDREDERRLSQESLASNSLTDIDAEIPTRLKTLHNLVLHYASQGRYEVAIPLCNQALEDLEKTSGHDHPDVATMLNILALAYRDQNKTRKAAKLLSDALAIREKTLGPDHPAVAATLNNLSVLYGKRRKYQEAEPLCKRALEIREKVLGTTHPDVAKQLNNLALLCQKQGKYDQVEGYYQRALQIYQAKLGHDNPNVDKTKNNLAFNHMKQGKYKAAEVLYKEILIQAYKNAFDNYDETEYRTDSAPYKECGEWHKSFGLDSPNIPATLKNLSALYRRQGNFAASEMFRNYANQAKLNLKVFLKSFELVDILSVNVEPLAPREEYTDDVYNGVSNGGVNVEQSGIRWQHSA